MAHVPQVGSIEIEQDLEFERRQWQVQRAGWVIVLLLLLAAVAGLLGAGPLSHEVRSAGPLTLEYGRFVRERTSSELQLELDSGAFAEGELTIWLDQQFFDKIELARIVPEPIEMAVAADRILYRFAVADAEQLAEITFHIEPADPGAVRGRLGVVDGEEIAFDQFIFP